MTRRIKYRRFYKSFNKIKKCQECGKERDLQVHHIIPISLGGNNAKDNLILVCEECHKRLDDEALGKYDYILKDTK